MTFSVVNISDLIASVGETEVVSALSEFKCAKNPEIEDFIKNSAVNFARRKISVTNLALDGAGQISAYFTLPHKPASIPAEHLSRTAVKTLSRYAVLNEDTNAFNISAFLIAQFGKNSAYDGTENISGNRMMELCFDVLESVQKQVSGGLVFLECEDKKPLLDFYQNERNTFRAYGERFSKSDETKYIQLLRFF